MSEAGLKLRDNMVLIKVNRSIFSPPGGFEPNFPQEPLNRVFEIYKGALTTMGFLGVPSDSRPITFVIHAKGKLGDDLAIFSINFIVNAKKFIDYEVSPTEWDSLIDLGDFKESEILKDLYERVVQKLKEEHNGTIKAVLGYGSYIELEFPPGSGIVEGGEEGEPETLSMALINWDKHIEPSEWGLD
jgi:hypothetical protein